MSVVQLRPGQPQLVTKKQLGATLGRSERWVELRVREGMPVLESTDRFGRRRYDLDAVREWLAQGKPQPRTPSGLAQVAVQVATLEGRVASLEHELSELLRRVG